MNSKKEKIESKHLSVVGNIEFYAPELIPLILDGVLTIDEAHFVQVLCEKSVVKGKLQANAEALLKCMRKDFTFKAPLTEKQGIETVYKVWKSGTKIIYDIPYALLSKVPSDNLCNTSTKQDK